MAKHHRFCKAKPPTIPNERKAFETKAMVITMKNKKIYILGSLNMDLVISSPYMPVAGETVKGGGFTMNPGGKGANQAAACGKLGGDTVMAGCVGDDLFGRELLGTLSAHNVDVSRIRKVDGSSGIAVIVLAEGDNRIILDAGANAKTCKNDVEVLLSDAEAGDIFLTQLENPTETVGEALIAAKAKGLLTVLNPAPWNDRIKPYLSYVDIMTPNETELALASGTDDIEKGLSGLLERGVGQIVVTLGGDGYRIFDREKDVKGECMKVDVVDTTAAGDTFNGAMVAELSRGVDIESAAAFASRCASLACTRLGAIRSIPEREEVNGMQNAE